MRTFVMGDIHGAYKALLQCLERSKFNYDKDVLIQLGDVTDGWSEVFEAIEELLKVKKLVAIKGNHDDFFAEYLHSGIHPAKWKQGGVATARSYLRQINKESSISQGIIGYTVGLNPGDVSETHHSFFKNQLLYYKDIKNRLFVHAGFARKLHIMDQANRDAYYWDRTLWTSALSCRDEQKLKTENNFHRIFIGHTNVHTSKNPHCLPLYAGGVWNIDTGAGWYGKLTIMDIDTEEYWQSDYVTDLYPDQQARR